MSLTQAFPGRADRPAPRRPVERVQSRFNVDSSSRIVPIRLRRGGQVLSFEIVKKKTCDEKSLESSFGVSRGGGGASVEAFRPHSCCGRRGRFAKEGRPLKRRLLGKNKTLKTGVL